uniref:Large ribosomal subunit protein uL22c n=1 Tax=Gracilaria tenuistipitata var. liui TaxID=285951 RepID=RK22_GRATL|nr:ribosomal protein L22 [Gracilaria tenuistipitata var. liui]Q6B8V8.1 RecName: Full=Large ribosomal subunit protein uL22c; AltName: Full=50S ribosomal protein L22, chloroplastic [Gracilaria tenuistipitata var. liui]AAT79677.1 50S ribosomal protein L22 [Gracilaria tenuistipitata var. liui]
MTNKTTNIQATGKYVRLSTAKTRRVLNQIKGKKYQEAILILEFMTYKPCKIIKKILESAGNNALNLKYEKQNLIIKQAFANDGPKLKRFQPRAQGRAFRIQKPTCHITINLSIN